MTALITITPPGGAAVTKTPEAWGFSQPFRWEYSPLPGRDTLSLRATRSQLTSFIAQKSRLQLKLDGVWAFDGIVVTDPRTWTGNESTVEIECQGPGYFLQAQYQLGIQSYVSSLVNPETGLPEVEWETKYLSHFTLNRDADGVLLGVRDQVSAILDYILARAITAFGYAPFQYSAADLADEAALPQDVMNITATQAIQYQMELMDAVGYFDHTVSPPAFKLRRRGSCTALTLPLGSQSGDNPLLVESVNGLVRSHDREVTYVKIDFEKTINGLPRVYTDVYPYPQPTNEFFPLATTVPLRGFESVTQQQEIVTASATNADLLTVAWWKTFKPELADAKKYFNLSIVSVKRLLVAADGSTSDITATNTLGKYIKKGTPVDWLPGIVQKHYIYVDFAFTRQNEDGIGVGKITHKTVRVAIDATNLSADAGKTYQTTDVGDYGEDPAEFVGMAQTCYEDMNAAAWFGGVALTERKFTGRAALGKLLSLTGGNADWAAMSALVQGITCTAMSGRYVYSLRLGANEQLDPGKLTDRLRARRQAYITVHFLINAKTVRGALVNYPPPDKLPPLTEIEPEHEEQLASKIQSGVTNVAGVSANPEGAFDSEAADFGANPTIVAGVKKPDGTLDHSKPTVVLQHYDLTGTEALRWRNIVACWDGQYYKLKVAGSKLTPITKEEADGIVAGLL